MIDEKLLLEALKQREERHNTDYEELDDCLEAQFIVAQHLQELKEIRELIQNQPQVDAWIPCH